MENGKWKMENKENGLCKYLLRNEKLSYIFRFPFIVILQSAMK